MTTGCETAIDAPTIIAAGADIFLKPDTELIAALVPRDTTLEKLLRDSGLASDTVYKSIAVMRSVFDPRRLRATQPYELERTPDGRIFRFDYEIDADTFLRVAPTLESEELTAEILPIAKERHEVVVAGNINGDTPSLFQAMQAAGEQPDLSIAMAEIFAGEIDFNTELQPGDRFGLAFEKFTREEHLTNYGAIAAAEFLNEGIGRMSGVEVDETSVLRP